MYTFVESLTESEYLMPVRFPILERLLLYFLYKVLPRLEQGCERRDGWVRPNINVSQYPTRRD